jgi:poly(A) polymerase
VQAVSRIEPLAWMTEPATASVLAALSAEGTVVRFVGGSVRDALLGREMDDIDIATPDPPERVVELLDRAAIKVVPTGLKHGTVTAVVPPRHFEITTLRQDVETFGRHARVAFTDDWKEDAKRRDFTMNALFLDAEGRIFDPVGGLADLRAGRVRFVGDPATRIEEDVLRLLRFYRFHAHFGRGEADAPARAACRALAFRLPGLSGERVQAELFKLLAAPGPLPTLALMAEDGVLGRVLPEAGDRKRLAALIPLDPGRDAVLRLAALLPAEARAAASAAERLRVSRAIAERLSILAEPPWPVDLAADPRAQRRALHHLGIDRYRDLVLLRAAESEPAQADRARDLLALTAEWPEPAFPLKGRDVAALGIPPGPEMGRLLAEVESWWEEGDFRADRAACLARLAELAAASSAS